MCEGASKQTPDLRILPRRDHAPLPRFEIPGSATAHVQFLSLIHQLRKVHVHAVGLEKNYRYVFKL